jgi:phage-related protein
MDITITISGPEFNLYAIVSDNRCFIQEFITNLEEKDLKQVLTLFKSIVEIGLPHNEQKFRNIGENIYELKTRGGVRILSFFAGPNLPKSLILTHGFFKSGNRIFLRERDKAIKWYKEFFESSDIKIVLQNGGKQP